MIHPISSDFAFTISQVAFECDKLEQLEQTRPRDGSIFLFLSSRMRTICGKATGKYLMSCQEDIKLFSNAAVSF